MDQNESLSSVERYNPALDSWEEVAPLSAPRRSVAVAALNGRLYAVGGSGRSCIPAYSRRWTNIKTSIFHRLVFAGCRIPANKKHSPIAGCMLCQRRRWTNIDPTMGQCLLFPGSIVVNRLTAGPDYIPF